MGNNVLFGFDDMLSAVGDWFHPTVRVHQGCLLSPTLFNIFLEWIMEEVLDSASSTVGIGGINISNLRYADDINIVVGSDTKLAKLVQRLYSYLQKVWHGDKY